MLGRASWVTLGSGVILGTLCLLYPLSLKTQRRDRKCRPDGIQVEVDPPNAEIEIIAVHGLGAHPEHTWTRDISPTQEADTGPRKIHLLRDLLPITFPKARILSFAYNSDWLSDAPIKSAQQIGEKLRSQLKERKDNQAGPRLPICFIGHSFGGIIIKQALYPLQSTDAIAEDTSGILFLGTPHQGSSLSVVGSFIARLTSFFGSSAGLLLSLEQHSSQLKDLADNFADFSEKCKDIKIRSFCETKPSYIFGVSIGLVVDQDSAKGPASKVTTVDTNHSGLNKCFGLLDPVYKVIQDTIVDMQCLSLLDQADICIRQSYSPEKLKIERLSEAKLLMTQCYINLALVHQHPGDLQYGEAVQPPAFRHSLLERFSVKEVSVDGHRFELETIFDPRMPRYGAEPKSPKRILIRGRPGMGKTTLCKKIVHDFHHCQLWNDRFKRLLWVPLRRLSQRRGPYTLRDLLRQEYFSQHSSPDLMLAEIYRQCNKSDDTESLFLLDGLDEIWPDRIDSDLKEFVQHLLNRPNVIVTSRPSVQFFGGINKFDLELETVGFYPAQVRQYVEHMEPENANSILSFLDKRPLIAGLVRIPIQLDALCFAWKDKSSGRNQPETMTDLYRAIEKGIWKKDAIALERINQKQTLYWTELEQVVEKEIILLETLAFTGMYNHLTIFDANTMTKISEHMPSTGLFIDSTLRRLSLLRSLDVSPFDGSREYYFMHLTLQEYFAARYIRRQWLKGDKDNLQVLDLSSGECKSMHPAIFLQQYKYDEHFDIVWRFLCGLLNSNPDKQVNLFRMIQSYPLDILGPAHQRLVMRCLFETKADFSLRKRLEDQLSTWLNFEYKLSQEDSRESSDKISMASEMEFPIEIIHRKLIDDQEVGRYLLQSIDLRRTIVGSIVDLAVVYLQNHSDKQGVLAALSFLERSAKISMLPEAVVQYVIERLHHMDTDIRRAALYIPLQIGPSLPPSMLAAVLQRQKDDDCQIRRAVIKIVKLNEHSLPRSTFEAIFLGSLNDKDVMVRLFAICVLEDLSNVPRPVLQAVERRLNDEKSIVRIAAAQILRKQSHMPEAVLESIDRKISNNSHVQMAAIQFLQNQPNIPVAELEMLAREIGNDDSEIRVAATQILKNQPNLPKPVLQAIARKLDSKDSIIGEAAIGILEKQSNMPIEVLELVARAIWNEKSEIRVTATQILRAHTTLPETVLQSIVERVSDEDDSVRQAASEALREQPNLFEALLRAVVQAFTDGKPGVRDKASWVLSGHSNFPEPVLEAIIQIIKDQDKDCNIRWAAITVFQNHPSLPEAVLQALVQMLQNECSEDQTAVRDALRAVSNPLKAHRNLPPPVLQAIVETLRASKQWDIQELHIIKCLENLTLPDAMLLQVMESSQLGGYHHQMAAWEVLEKQPVKSTSVLEHVASRLDDSYTAFVSKAKVSLRSRPCLPCTVLKIVAKMLNKFQYQTRWAAIEILEIQQSLPEALLHEFVQMVDDENSTVSRAATEALGKRSQLPEAVLARVAEMLERKGPKPMRKRNVTLVVEDSDAMLKSEDSDAMLKSEDSEPMLKSEASDVVRATLYVLSRQSNLPDAILQVVARNIPQKGSSSTDRELLRLLRNNPRFASVAQSTGSFEALFGYMLRQSFNVHFVWHLCDKKPYFIIDGVRVEQEKPIPTPVLDEARKACFVPAVVLT